MTRTLFLNVRSVATPFEVRPDGCSTARKVDVVWGGVDNSPGPVDVFAPGFEGVSDVRRELRSGSSLRRTREHLGHHATDLRGIQRSVVHAAENGHVSAEFRINKAKYFFVSVCSSSRVAACHVWATSESVARSNEPDKNIFLRRSRRIIESRRRARKRLSRPSLKTP